MTFKYKYKRYEGILKHLCLGCYGTQLMKTGNWEGILICCGKKKEIQFSKCYTFELTVGLSGWEAIQATQGKGQRQSERLARSDFNFRFL